MKVPINKEWFDSRVAGEEEKSTEVRPAKETPLSGSERRLVMPNECGRYLWDDEPVWLWWQDGTLVADAVDYSDTPEENSDHHQTSPDAPWLKIGECDKDDCSGHNAEFRC